MSAEIGAALADMSFWSLAGVIEADIDSTVDVSVVLSVALAGGNGGMVTRTSWDGTETVRGWRVTATDVEPLTEAQVFAAYCTDAMTGEPIPPEHGVRYAAGIPLT
ncbi:hypothetical protein ACIO3O_38060 [Streptomyces sp. NPDC087440]|uniref:hypothetical protein n=1 Tax=Streptomyces sp. NPDC087440 TaxID=3365790 RepID=UPI0038031F36